MRSAVFPSAAACLKVYENACCTSAPPDWKATVKAKVRFVTPTEASFRRTERESTKSSVLSLVIAVVMRLEIASMFPY